ncbi:MAG: GntR family transcriptional regulator [Chloroflexi bacterium]|nr:GntR family transcriptional regulator [Chloroflexota bacterium]
MITQQQPATLRAVLGAPIHGHPPLRQVVYERLKQAIIEGQFGPGEHLVETKIAKQLGVSRVPVREAIRRLEQEQLVTTSGKGMVVSSLTRASIQEVYTVRAVLEALVCRLAAQRLTQADADCLRQVLERSRLAIERQDLRTLTACDVEFHDVLAAVSGNATLLKLLAELRDSVSRFRHASIALPNRPQEVLRDHTAIADAVMAGDADRAQKLVHDHILEAARRLLDSLPIT